jgi:hypothetical protein
MFFYFSKAFVHANPLEEIRGNGKVEEVDVKKSIRLDVKISLRR